MNDTANLDITRGLILTVCSANVCRSPLSELTLAEVGRRNATPVRFASAGLAARTGAAMCHMAARGIPDEPASHAARELDRELATSADLILTMEKEQRGQVARVAPGTQAKTFTLTEAAALLDLLLPLVSAGAQARFTSMRDIAAALHGLRGRLPLDPPSRRRRELHSTTGAWMSIPDGHNQSTSAHVAVVDGVRQTSVRVATGIAAVMVETLARPAAEAPSRENADHAAA